MIFVLQGVVEGLGRREQRCLRHSGVGKGLEGQGDEFISGQSSENTLEVEATYWQ